MAGAFATESFGDFMSFALSLFGLVAEAGGGEILGGFVEVFYTAFDFLGFAVVTAPVAFVVVTGMASFAASRFAGVVFPEFIDPVGQVLGFLHLAGAFGGLKFSHELGHVLFGGTVLAVVVFPFGMMFASFPLGMRIRSGFRVLPAAIAMRGFDAFPHFTGDVFP